MEAVNAGVIIIIVIPELHPRPRHIRAGQRLRGAPESKSPSLHTFVTVEPTSNPPTISYTYARTHSLKSSCQKYLQLSWQCPCSEVEDGDKHGKGSVEKHRGTSELVGDPKWL